MDTHCGWMKENEVGGRGKKKNLKHVNFIQIDS